MADPKDENQEPSSAKASDGEEDKVAAAYENISKKLESIRNGKSAEDDEESKGSEESKDSDEELEEWKGPRPGRSEKGEVKREGDEAEEEEVGEIRRVRLDKEVSENSENSEESESSEDRNVRKSDKESELETSDIPEKLEDDSNESDEPVKKWKPEKDDPLDEEAGSEDSEDQDSDDSDQTENPTHRLAESSEFSEKDPQPDSLDDLTEDEYEIPHLKASRQGGSNLGYNTPSETETFDRGYQSRSDSIGSRSDRGQDKSSMETNDPNNFFSQHNQPAAPKRANKFHLLVLVIIGVAVIGFTVYILKGGFGEIGIGTSTPSPSPTVEATPTPTPTPTPEPERSNLKLRVLNGSGKTGLAKTVADKLKELGYQIDKTGNATNSAFTETIIRVKPAGESFIPQLVKDLTPDFEAAGNTSLEDDDNVDIEIILGSK